MKKRFNNGRAEVRVHAFRQTFRWNRSSVQEIDGSMPTSTAVRQTTAVTHHNEPRLVGFSCTLRDDGNVAARALFR